MKNHTVFFLLCAVCFTLSCKQQQTVDTKTIPFEYDDKMLKLIIFKATLNDSIPLNVMFDTGGSSSDILLSDSLAELLADTMANLQIGAYKSTCPIDVRDKNHPSLRYFDAMIGWQFFKDKIIEISYQHKYIRELDSIPVSNDFFPIRMDNQLKIPVKVYVQGKCIEDNILVDTGNNGSVSLGKYFIDRYEIDLTDAYHGTSMTTGGLLPGGSIPVDSIVLGRFALPDVIISFSTMGNPRMKMIGNRVLEHFTVILDLKNYYLYLKPNE